jgi:hypothetical protein
MRCSLLLVLLSLTAVGCRITGPVTTRDGGMGPAPDDADGDTISDEHEGMGEGRDSDGDGTPDYLDDDSDNDGIPDVLEAGDGDPATPPNDPDGDGTPSYLDLDSDGNGLPDSGELEGDIDGDGTLNAHDTDDDGDFVGDADEIGGDPSAPADTDRDGVPDFQDPDSDNDTIADVHERNADTDNDGTPDDRDLDSDRDGVTDADEAGDGDPFTAPIDTDGDTIPNFRDPDSDGDGLADGDEVFVHRTSPIRGDSDGDGVSDLIEIAAGTDANSAADSPRTRGDFVFVEPYMAPPMPPRDTLDFETNLRTADVYFLVDVTGSMGNAITDIRTRLSMPGGIIERVRATIPDTWFGIGEYQDWNEGAGIYVHRQDITDNVAAAQAAANVLTTGWGGDTPEAGFQAAWAAATGNGFTVSGSMLVNNRTGCPAGTFGYPCWRERAVRILVMVGDAPFHNGPGGSEPTSAYFGYERIGDIQDRDVRAIGVTTDTGLNPSSAADFRRFATDTGAVDGAGNPLVSVFTCTSTGCPVGDEVVNQITTLASQTPIDISVAYEDDGSDAVNTLTAFVDHIEANTAGDPGRGCAARAAEDTNGDGYGDTFRRVTPGNPVCFDIVVRQNDTVMPLLTPQLFRAVLRVFGDGFTELDSRDIYFIVPPMIPDPGGPI